ncbi:iron chaperone [Pedobacter sp. SYSU D00535]|uniref:iron chaperone n=1 Tax=Pedobacter sp. SYSU D00535 TaxID=2810308 RepID=UPI001A9771A6|nr:DUF1801 domain-containing protein [Pedobacter sp. SYSU D00535]
MNKIETIDAYIAGFPQDVQTAVTLVRETIRTAAPSAEEKISYGLPAYILNKKPLVYFGAFKNHIGFYALPSGTAAFQQELSRYKIGKGSIQFPLSEPMPLSLITSIVKFRIEELSLELEKNTKTR